MTQTQEMALIYVKSHDFLKQLVESLLQNGSDLIRERKSYRNTVSIVFYLAFIVAFIFVS